MKDCLVFYGLWLLPQIVTAQAGAPEDTIPGVAENADSLATFELASDDPFSPDADTFFFNRFLYHTPTAFSVKKGKYVFNHAQFILNTLNYGATDNLTIGGGVLPFFIANTVFANAKWTVAADSMLRFGVGLMMNGIFQYNFPEDPGEDVWSKWAAFSGMATVTLGNERAYLNAGIAKVLVRTHDLNSQGEKPVAFGLGAGIMTSPRFRIVADGTFILSPGNREIQSAVVTGVSFISKKKSGSLGLILVGNDKWLVIPVYSILLKF
jgi:hypothetical protein